MFTETNEFQNEKCLCIYFKVNCVLFVDLRLRQNRPLALSIKKVDKNRKKIDVLSRLYIQSNSYERLNTSIERKRR